MEPLLRKVLRKCSTLKAKIKCLFKKFQKDKGVPKEMHRCASQCCYVAAPLRKLAGAGLICLAIMVTFENIQVQNQALRSQSAE